jgi:uncharacterized membrane protein YbhN (UPF0104 family)
MRNGERHLASHVFNVAVLAIGAGALAWMLHRLGLAQVRDLFADIGWSFAPILACDLAATFCDAAAIHAFMRPEARMVSYWRVLAAQAAGRGVNLVTPGGALGEATKVTMLVGHAPRTRVISSIVLFNLASLYLSVGIIVVGVPITLALVDMPHHLRVVVWTALAILIPAVIALGVVIHRGAVETLVAMIRGLRLISGARAEAWKAKLLEFDRHLRELHAERSPGTTSGFALVCASRLCSWAGTIAVLEVVGVTLRAPLIVGLLSVGMLVGWISSIVPLGIGLADGSNYALFGVLGASGAHGVLVTLVGRARSLMMALIGLVVMAVGHVANRISIARRNRRRVAQPAA